jgi:hypothetical protein
MTFAKKITVMALLGALGATVGAVVGEALFLGKGPLRAEPRKICLLFDVSGSMGEAVVMPGGERVMSCRRRRPISCAARTSSWTPWAWWSSPRTPESSTT